ncbi:hypothetical protein [Herminiimonas sp. CN]|uniref:hypothetical protein n=1 Tax=Herminiimonas sp. CN TaxID=1349818 RepID=UPI0004735C6A|nr:hypothetical protein [Herminiimonas sp. CN]
MKRVIAGASIALSILATHDVRAADLRAEPQQKKIGNSNRAENSHGLMIRVAAGEWGDAQPEEIEALLYAVADQLLVHFPQRQLNPIVVSPTYQNPIVLYQKGPANEYQVHLAAKGRRWAEYVYEFSHELFHILANYENHAPPRIASHLWFEETLCETVSLYALRRMSASWAQSPPRPEWAAYAPVLNAYAGRVLGEPHRRLPANASLAQWFKENGPLLLENPYLRGKNELIANLFLPILEHNQDWQAVGFLNLDAPQQKMNFYDYLASWHSRTPPEHQEFTRLALRMFQFDAPETVAPKLTKAAEPAPVRDQPADQPGAIQQLLGAAGSSRK